MPRIGKQHPLTQAKKGEKQMGSKKVSASAATRVRQERSGPGIDGAVPDELLRMRDAAGILSCSLAQTYRLANEGVIPALRIRGMVRVPRARLMAWIAANSTGGAAE
jgi:excisionase family DNA binding protein